MESTDSKVESLDYVTKAQALKEEGNKLFQKRDYETAMSKYGEAIKLLDRDHVEVSHIRAYIATCYMQLEPPEFAKAIRECDLALSVTPDHTKSLLKRARCYEALNKLDLALRDVCLVLELDPNNPMASEMADKVKRGLESKGLRVNEDSVIELASDYVEPVVASPALWVEEGKKKKKKKKSKSESEDVETEKKKEEEKEKEKSIDKKVKGKQQSDTSNEQEKAITEEKLVEDVMKIVKLVYVDDIRLAKLRVNCTLFELRGVVHERFPSLRAVHIKYKDQEGDLVTITTDQELRMCEDTLRFYVVEVSPQQDPFFGRLVEMKITADSFKRKVSKRVTCQIEDWMIEFARLFKIQAKVDDSDACLNLQDLGMKLNSEAMEEILTSDAAQEPFDKAAQQFREMAGRSLLKLGNVLMSRARKRLSLSASEEVKTAYEWSLKEYVKAKEKYEEAIKIKPDLFEVFLALGLQQFEEARVSWYYVLISNLDLKTWRYEVVIELYQSAESNIKKCMAISTQDNAEKIKSWLDVLLCVVLYERSIMEYKLEIPIWRESFEAAMEKHALAGSCISEEYVADNTLRDLRFHMEEIVEIFHEINEAKQWRNGIPSDQLEEILKKRIDNIFCVSSRGIERG